MTENNFASSKISTNMKYLFKIALLTTLIAICAIKVYAQKTRPMTAAETGFYEKLLKLLKTALPHENYNNLLLTDYTKDFYPHRLEELPKDEGPYQFTYTILFRKPDEYVSKEIEKITKRMEGVTEAEEILKLGRELEIVTLNAEMRVQVHINESHSAFTTRNGDYKIKDFNNKEYQWGSLVKQAAAVPTVIKNEGITKNETKVIIGTGNPFKFYPDYSGPGGSLVSTAELPVKKGSEAFKIYNIIISIEAAEEEAVHFLNSIDWTIIKNNLSKL